MIQKLFYHPLIVHQTADDKDGMPEQSIALCTDSTPIIVISQEGREIVINLATVPELCKALKETVGILKSKKAGKP